MINPTFPIAGVGTETYGFASGWVWCGYCGYTGFVKGPKQAACDRFIWHAWLEHCAELEILANVPEGPR